MIKAEKLHKKYNLGKLEVPVLNGISLEVKKGEYVIISGRSGAGKSTLLYLLGLLDSPTEGDVFVDDVNITKLSEDEKNNYRLENFGYVFQDYALLPELNAWENVALPLLMKGMSTEEAKEKAKGKLIDVGLGEKIDNLPNQLSGGQQQRVSIARAIVTEPRILFADEPTANLDNKTAAQVMEVFKKIKDKGQTIIMVTHEIKKAIGVDRVVELLDGKIKK